MAWITVNGTNLYYKDWGAGKPIVFVHGWCINCDSWENVMHPLAANGYRCIAYDQRGCGRSHQPWDGYDMQTLAEDLYAFISALSLDDVTLVGHSMGCGVIMQYLYDNSADRVSHAVLTGTTTPCALATGDGRGYLTQENIDSIIALIQADRPGYVESLAADFFYTSVINTSQAMIDWAVNLTTQASSKAATDMFITGMTTNQAGMLPDISLPVLIMHGDKDMGCPIDATAEYTHALLKNSTLKIYPGQPHGFYITHGAAVAADIMAFIS